MKENKSITGIILVAGNSKRFGKNRNKNFEILDGKSVLSYSLEVFDKNKYIDDIIIAGKEEEISQIQNIITHENLSKKVKIVIGGVTRKQSIYNCLNETNSDLVVIHDGARPLIKDTYINQCIDKMKDYDGTTIGVKSKDTIKITDENNIVINTTERKYTWVIQTPQCFEKNILLKMHEKYMDKDVTDDCTLLEMENYKIKVIEGDYTNIKITTSDDFIFIKNILNKKDN